MDEQRCPGVWPGVDKNDIDGLDAEARKRRRAGMGEDVVRCLPFGVLVGIVETATASAAT
jgi:hypothetical protein